MADSHDTEPFRLSGNLPRAKRRNSGQFQPGQHWRPRRQHWSAEWCHEEYVVKQRSASEIADELGITETGVLYWLKKHGIACRTISETRAIKHWGATGPDNPMFGKTGELNARWKGGISPERQCFYSSYEWKKVKRLVRKRDKRTCQKCGLVYQRSKGVRFHIHHIVSFAVVELRTEPTNLILLCKPCHNWVHSRANVNGDFIERKEV